MSKICSLSCALFLTLFIGCSHPQAERDISYLSGQEDGRAFQNIEVPAAPKAEQKVKQRVEKAVVKTPAAAPAVLSTATPSAVKKPVKAVAKPAVATPSILKKESAPLKRVKKNVVPKPIDHNKQRLTVVLDAGHGGFDIGAQKKGCEEKDLNLRTALVVRKILAGMGYNVIMTRTRDEYISLQKRAEIANKAKSQLLVSIHYNAALSEEAHGIEIFYPAKADSWRLKRSKQLAQTVFTKLLAATQAESRGVKEANFCVIREARMPSILIECGFITNEKERKQINSESYMNKVAESIALGIHQYFSEATAAIY